MEAAADNLQSQGLYKTQGGGRRRVDDDDMHGEFQGIKRKINNLFALIMLYTVLSSGRYSYYEARMQYLCIRTRSVFVVER